MRGIAGFWNARRDAARCARYLGAAVSLAARETPPREAGLLASFLVPLLDARGPRLGALLTSWERQRPGLCELVFCGAGARGALAAPGVVVAPKGDTIAGALAAGLAAARAPWVGRLDAQGELAPFAVDAIARALADNPETLWLYTDEVLTDWRRRPIEALLKPAFDPVLLESLDYPGRISLFRRDRLRALGGWREEAGGAADHDLSRRYAEGLGADAVLHLPYPAYLGRRRSSVAAARGAIRSGSRPKVSVIIPSRNSLELIQRVLEGLFRETDYPDLEVLVVDNGSTDRRVVALYEEIADREPRFRFHIEAEPFNFSRAINRGVMATTGELALLLNNDVEILHRDWLMEMVGCFDREDVGVVGAKLLYPDRKLQHAGVIAGLGGYAGHWYIGREPEYAGPMGRLAARQSLSVVTGACMLVSRRCLETVGGFDETTFPIAYNDVDFCLRAGALGFRVVWTPFATLIHHESASRGSDETSENIARFTRDKANLRARHRTDVIEDRAFNPWYTKGESLPFPTPLDQLPKAR